MAKLSQNDSFFANNVRTLAFTITNVDVTPNAPVDLTGYTVQWALSQYLANGSYSTNAILKKDNGTKGGVVVTDTANGKCEVRLTDADTANLAGKYYQELELVDGDGNALVVATGTITVSKNVDNT